jgi:hypothetical protein
MLELLIFILACYGMTMILVYGKIFESIRTKIEKLEVPMLTYMIKCTMCTGLWVGFFWSICMDTEFGMLVGGCISAGTSYFLSKIVNDEGIVVNSNKNN